MAIDVMIRNVDEESYRRLKARAALEGRNVGDLTSSAFRAYLEQDPLARSKSIRDIKPLRLPKGNERLSEQVDEALYGA